MRRTARALGATILLAGLLIGIPLGLATTIGNPLDSWPAIKAGDASARVVIDLLAAVVWLCWAQFAAATLLEAWAAARHVSLPTHVPFIFGGGRQLARSLIVAAFMLGPALGSLTPPLGHAPPPPPPRRDRDRRDCSDRSRGRPLPPDPLGSRPDRTVDGVDGYAYR
jgi:hypothetical protein